MLFVLTLSATVILTAIFTNRFLKMLGIPALLFFLCLGMLFGSNSLLKINYSDFNQAKELASIALGFIIFYGGFCTKWRTAKPVLIQAAVLSTLGVFLTALSVGAFCYIILKLSILESFLIGAVISSTDAASVFSILRTKKLHLKDHTAPLLELESGSNDPMSYVLVILIITLILGKTPIFVFWLFIKQVVLGIFIGIIIAKMAIYVFQKTKIVTDGNDSLFVAALVLTGYSLPHLCDGNPFLAVYFLGIILGNEKIDNKGSMMNFFNSVTKLAQIGIFFILGLLATPEKLPNILYSGGFIFLFLTFIARPSVIFCLLYPFKSTLGQKLVVSWAGLRGVASIVFAIIAMDSGISIEYDLFHLVFLISVLSVALQGSLLPFIAHAANMVDEKVDIKKTFNDYQEECAIKYMRVTVPNNHPWVGKKIRDIKFPNDSLVLVIKRGKERILPKRNTVILAEDRITLSIPAEDT